jgi:DNA-binding ferritin-like protein
MGKTRLTTRPEFFRVQFGGAVMQVTVGVDAEQSRQIERELSELRSRIRRLRLATADLEGQVTGALCSTLRLVLAAQGDELRGAEAELARWRPAVSGTYRVGRTHEPDRCAKERQGRVDEQVAALLDRHDAASAVARCTARRAREAGDLPLYELLARRSDAHDEAAWTLAPLVLSSVVSCEVCAVKGTCPISAAVPDNPLSATLGRKVDELTLAARARHEPR